MNKLITLLHLQKCLDSIKSLIGEILSTTVGAINELESKITPDTWKPNTKDSEGYVAKGEGNPNKVWGTDADGNPGWIDTPSGDVVCLDFYIDDDGNLVLESGNSVSFGIDDDGNLTWEVE